MDIDSLNSEVLTDVPLQNILELAEGADLEVKASLGRDGRGELPKSFWETYSAMANTDGGVVLLGVAEVHRGVFRAVGIKDVPKVQKALWDGVNNREQISANLLTAKSVETVAVGGLTVLRITIPRAKRHQRPIYVGRNPLSGTYQRNYEGDYRCDEETVRRLLAEQVEDERDSKILSGFSISDLDADTLKHYRGAVRAAKPNLTWNDHADIEFLTALGALKRDRDTGQSGLTLGGLLMLGRLPSIQEAVPNYMLDYQERPAPKSELRWIDRLTADGEWSGNLYDFCRLVLKRLYKDLPVPFQMTSGIRVDDTPVHAAIREALVNTLIHADFSGRTSILIVKRPDLFGFRNPGCMRVSLEDALAGGNSDCRNRVLQRLFRMAGYAEQAGYGIPTIYSGWKKQLWRAPSLLERRDGPEQTVLTMPMISLLSDQTVASLEARFGSSYRHLTDTQQMALATVAVEGKVSHAKLKTMVYDHPKDITAALSYLCREGFLESAGVARGRFYFFPGESPAALEGEPLLFEATDTSTGRSEQMARTSEQMRGASEQMARDSEHWKHLLELARPVRESGKAPREKVAATLIAVCANGYLTLKELQEIMGRSVDSLRVHYLNKMAREGKIRLRHPKALSHPNQAYTSSQQRDNSEVGE